MSKMAASEKYYFCLRNKLCVEHGYEAVCTELDAQRTKAESALSRQNHPLLRRPE